MSDLLIHGELASRLEAVAKQKQVSVEQLIGDLLELLDASGGGLHPEDRAWLELSGQSFTFWDNDEDAVYDDL